MWHFPAIVEIGVLARKGSPAIKLTSRRHIAVSKYSHILVYTNHPVFFTGQRSLQLEAPEWIQGPLSKEIMFSTSELAYNLRVKSKWKRPFPI